MEKWKPINAGSLRLILHANRTGSTPGMYMEVSDARMHNLLVTVSGTTGNSPVRVWIGTKNHQTLAFSEESEIPANTTMKKCYLFKNVKYEGDLSVGVLFVSPTRGYTFELIDFKVEKIRKPPIDVLFLTPWDSATSGWDLCKALRLLGLNTFMLQGKAHEFGYSDQAPVYSPILENTKRKGGYIVRSPFIITMEDKFVNTLIEKSKFIVWHSCPKFICSSVTPEKMQHSAPYCVGRNYRSGPENCGFHFRECCRLLASTPDLYGKNKYTQDVLLQWPVELEKYPVSYEFENKEKIIIGHFPSNTKAKNTVTIASAVEELENNEEYSNRFEYIGVREDKGPIGSEATIKWEDHVKRYRRCDIYIESLQLVVDGSQCGTWGVTCFEAAASGCIVITNQLYADIYEKEYGYCPVYIANSREEIVQQLKKVLSLSREELLEKKKEFRKWVVDNHGYWATAKRMWRTTLFDHFDHNVQERVENTIKERDNALKDA